MQKMRILFCNIAWMKYYKGIDQNDKPKNGGSYVKEYNDAGEIENFLPVSTEETGEEFCYGYVETKSTNGKEKNQIHIEKLDGCELLKNEGSAENVLVIFCAKHKPKAPACVVGWYKEATVYRKHRDLESEGRIYNIIAEKKNVVLLPEEQRLMEGGGWNDVPRAGKEKKYGFGQANVWFPSSAPNAPEHDFIARIVKQINEYDGENWVDKTFEQPLVMRKIKKVSYNEHSGRWVYKSEKI